MNVTPEFREFERLARDGNYIPVGRELLGDVETPVSILARLIGEENCFLLESVEGGERIGRYSFLGVNPHGVFAVEAGRPVLYRQGRREELDFDGNPLNALRTLLGQVRAVEYPGLPGFFGGAAGFLNYEAVNFFEELPAPKGESRTPDALFMLLDDIIVFDNVRHTVRLLCGVRTDEHDTPAAAYAHGEARLTALEKLVGAPADRLRPEPPVRAPGLEGNMTRSEFCRMAERALAYIRAGEAIQIVLSQKFTAPAVNSPLQLYRALRYVNPSPYTFLLKFGSLALVGSSPETLIKLEHGRASLRPIAGTRPRGRSSAEDRKHADELLADPKERAEHLMLLDLGRNDLGRTARPGSVQVKSFMNVERYSHVMHLVSEVDALLREDCDGFDLLSGAFPAGTLSGAPKVRAMELIHELEPEPRGAYGGAAGYFGYNGNLDFAITIRTMELKDGRLTIQAGAGIVHDSAPEAEYEETMNKAGAMFRAVKLAADGLVPGEEDR